MIIKSTQKDGLGIQTKTGKALLSDSEIKIFRDEGKQEKPFVINTLGEFEVSGIAVFSFEPKPTFIIEADHLTIVYIPSHTKQEFNENVLSELERVDILLIPGKRAELVSKLAPYLVIPLDDAEDLAKSLKQDLPEPSKTLNIKSHSELPEETEIVFLNL